MTPAAATADEEEEGFDTIGDRLVMSDFLLKLVIVFGGGWLLTTRAIPWIYVKIARALGFRAKMTPITAKRVERFKPATRVENACATGSAAIRRANESS